MKRKILLLSFIIAICLTGCGKESEEIKEPIQDEQTDEQIQSFEMLDEIKNTNLTDKKIQITDKIIELPIKVNDFIEQTGFNFSPYFGSNYNADSKLSTGETGTVYMTTDNYNILMVEITNLTQQERKLSKCYVTGISLSQTNDIQINKHQYNIVYMMGGISFGDNFTDIEEILKDIEVDNSIEATKNNNIIKYYEKNNCALTICFDNETKIINEIKYNVNIKNSTK